MMSANTPVERSENKRTAVLLPVELLVFDTDGASLSPEPIQGMVLNASANGVHMTFVGPAVNIFSVNDWRLSKVKLRFLVGKLATAKPMVATIRWSSKVDMGWGIGVQWEDASAMDAEHLLEQLVAYSSYRPEYDKPRRPVAWMVGASLTVAALVGMHAYDQQLSNEQLAEVQDRADKEGRGQLDTAMKACDVRVEQVRASATTEHQDTVTAAAFQAAEKAHAAKVAATQPGVAVPGEQGNRQANDEGGAQPGAAAVEVAAHE